MFDPFWGCVCFAAGAFVVWFIWVVITAIEDYNDMKRK